MNEEMLKDLLRTKLKITNSVINMLPPELKEQVAGFQQSILKVVNEVTKEYATDKTSNENNTGLKPISID